MNIFKKLLWWKKWPLESNKVYTFKEAEKLLLNDKTTNYININITNLAPWVAKVMLDKLKENLSENGKYEVVLIGKTK